MPHQVSHSLVFCKLRPVPDVNMTKRNTRKVFNEFCESTSLHGYNYWYNADSVILKVAWAFVILAATCLGIVFLANQTKEYIDGTILTTIETSSAPLNVRLENLSKFILTCKDKTPVVPFNRITLQYSLFKEI